MAKRERITDYSFMVGQHYGNLQVLEVKTESSGWRNLHKAVVICTCGAVTKVECWRLLKGVTKSCHTANCSLTSKARREKKKKYVWNCPFPIGTCRDSRTYGRCCRECNKSEDCQHVCLNTPEKCGAAKREWAHGK